MEATHVHHGTKICWDKLHEDEDDGDVTQARMTPVAPLNAITVVKNSVLETVAWMALEG